MREMRVELHPAQGALRAQSSLSGELSAGPDPGGFAQTIMPSIFPAVGLASIGATVGSFLGVAAVTGGLGVVAGLALVPVTLVHRRRVRDQQEAQNLARTGLDRAKTEVPPLLSENVLRMRRAVEQDMQSEIERREHELAQAVEDRQQLLRSELAKRERAKTDAQGRLDELKALRQQADELYRLIDVEHSA